MFWRKKEKILSYDEEYEITKMFLESWVSFLEEDQEDFDERTRAKASTHIKATLRFLGETLDGDD
jgi:hypothetical protein